MTLALIVDDKEENLYYLRTLLTADGCEVESAGDGVEALEKARKSPPDIVISDLLMPVMDGYTLLRHWKADPRLNRAPFIVYTATYTEPEDERLALSLGADAFILKPSEPDAFLARFRAVRESAASAVATPTQGSAGNPDELLQLREYSEALVRKLEKKTLQLEESNRSLQKDIAARELAETALRTSEMDFRQLAESMPQIVWIAQPDGAHVYFNQQWVDYTGLSLAQSLGDGWNAPFHPEDKQAAWDAWQHAHATVGTYSIECRLRRADGSYRWWLIRGVPILDPGGKVLKWFGTCTEIDALKQSEATLRESEALLRIAGRAARLGGWSVSIPDARVTWSDEVCRIHEVPSGTVPSLAQAISYYAPEFRDTIREKFEACTRDGTSFDVELQIITSTRRRVWVRALGDAERSATGAITIVRGAFQDIDVLRNVQEQLRQAQKMEAVGRLAGGVAHDFNNLLSVVLSHSELMVEQLKAGDPMRDDLEEIRKAGVRAAALTRQLLMFSRQQVVEPKVLNIADVLGDMEKMLQRILGEDVDLVFVPNSLLGRVKLDPSSLDQIVMNLVVNARDAMPTGGQLTIETSNVDLDDDFARAHVGTAPGPYVMLAVSDTGLGMDKATQARIFEPFFTTKDRDKGTGLGLSTVYGIARQSGGIVLVYSEPGAGTCFKVYLPRVDGALDTARVQVVVGSLRGTETILLVEDEDQVRLVASSILRKQGYRILEARNAGEALLLCEREADGIHLLLTDVVMPKMSGPELAKRLAQIRPSMRVLCMSGYTDDSIVRHGVLQAHMSYLQKPITPQTLARKVREVLDAPL